LKNACIIIIFILTDITQVCDNNLISVYAKVKRRAIKRTNSTYIGIYRQTDRDRPFSNCRTYDKAQERERERERKKKQRQTEGERERNRDRQRERDREADVPIERILNKTVCKQENGQKSAARAVGKVRLL
jgi:hypothetical protein